MARPAPADEGSPARLIATMVGIVGILLLGSLAWSAVGALFATVGEAAATFTSSGTPSPKLTLRAGTPAPPPAKPAPAGAASQSGASTPVPQASASPTAGVPSPTPSPSPSSTPTPDASTPTPIPTPSPGGRSPWVLLPLPAPDSQVAAGPLVVEARGRGDSAITAIRLELDGSPLSVALEQRSESTWRGSANAQVAPGHHSVRATVVDDQGRTGSFRWGFDANP